MPRHRGRRARPAVGLRVYPCRGLALRSPECLCVRLARGARHDVGRLAAGRRHSGACLRAGLRGRALVASRRVVPPSFTVVPPFFQGVCTMQLTEQYRPRTWDEVIGQDKVVSRIRALAKRGLAGRAYWLSGSSGTCNTTISRLIAQDVASECHTDALDAGALTCAALRDLARGLSLPG